MTPAHRQREALIGRYQAAHQAAHGSAPRVTFNGRRFRIGLVLMTREQLERAAERLEAKAAAAGVQAAGAELVAGVPGAVRELLEAARGAQRVLMAPRPRKVARAAAGAALGPAIAKLEAELLAELQAEAASK